jgi:hypothetical protein
VGRWCRRLSICGLLKPAVAGTSVLALFIHKFSKSEERTRNASSKMVLYLEHEAGRSGHPSFHHCIACYTVQHIKCHKRFANTIRDELTLPAVGTTLQNPEYL